MSRAIAFWVKKMRTKPKIRRRWRADPDAAEKLIARLQPFSDSEQTALTLPVRISWQCILTGSGSEGDWHNLACCANICLVRSESINPTLVDACNLCCDGLQAMRDRAQRTGRWAACHQTLQAIPGMLDLYEEIMQLSTPEQMQQAMTTVLQRMAAQRKTTH
jgi:hypothetical protein